MNDLQDRPVQMAGPPDVGGWALANPLGMPEAIPARLRRRTVIVGVAIATLVAGPAGGEVWWQRAVTGDPGIEFYDGPNFYRDAVSTDRGGINEKRNMLGREVDIDFASNGRLYAHFGLYNGGHHEIGIEGAGQPRLLLGLRHHGALHRSRRRLRRRR